MLMTSARAVIICDLKALQITNQRAFLKNREECRSLGQFLTTHFKKLLKPVSLSFYYEFSKMTSILNILLCY
jgi:hypothetical protein